jgi:hypothetical protein
MSSARLIVSVTAGLIPERPEPELTRQWVLTSDEWEQAENQREQLSELNGRAQGYAMLLMLQPDRFNWVRTDWLWL